MKSSGKEPVVISSLMFLVLAKFLLTGFDVEDCTITKVKTAVVVIYICKYNQRPAYRSLRIEQESVLALSLRLLVFSK